MSVTDLSERNTGPSAGRSGPCVSSGYGCALKVLGRGIRVYSPGTERLAEAETSRASTSLEASLLQNLSRIYHLNAILIVKILGIRDDPAPG